MGGIIALIGFFWGASGLHLNLTRAMERSFTGERVSGAFARVVGVLLVFLIIVGVLAAVLLAGVATVVARALQLDGEWVLAAGGAAATFAVAAGIVYWHLPCHPLEPTAGEQRQTAGDPRWWRHRPHDPALWRARQDDEAAHELERRRLEVEAASAADETPTG